jgi:hypothetical protein
MPSNMNGCDYKLQSEMMIFMNSQICLAHIHSGMDQPLASHVCDCGVPHRQEKESAGAARPGMSRQISGAPRLFTVRHPITKLPARTSHYYHRPLPLLLKASVQQSLS